MVQLTDSILQVACLLSYTVCNISRIVRKKTLRSYRGGKRKSPVSLYTMYEAFVVRGTASTVPATAIVITITDKISLDYNNGDIYAHEKKLP